MALYELNAADLADLNALISSPTLAIQANQAARVSALQKLLREAQPSERVQQLEKTVADLETQVTAALKARDSALLEAGLLKKRIDELEHASSEVGESGDKSAG